MHAPFGSISAAVLGLAIKKGRNIVAGHVLQQRQRLRAANFNFPHVAHVEKSCGGAHRKVLADDAGILHWHVPAAIIHHLRAGFAMRSVESGLFQRGSSRNAQPKAPWNA